MPLTRPPYLHGVIDAGGGKLLAIEGPGYGSHVAGVATVGEDITPGDGIPDLYHLIVAARGKITAIGRPRDGIQAGGSSAIDDVFPAAGRVPHLRAFIRADRGNTLPSGRPGQPVDPAGMAFVDKLAARRHEKRAKEATLVFEWGPDLHAFIFAAGGDTLAIGRPGHGKHFTGMAAIGKGQHSTGNIPYLHGFIFACRGDALAIG